MKLVSLLLLLLSNQQIVSCECLLKSYNLTIKMFLMLLLAFIFVLLTPINVKKHIISVLLPINKGLLNGH